MRSLENDSRILATVAAWAEYRGAYRPYSQSTLAVASALHFGLLSIWEGLGEKWMRVLEREAKNAQRLAPARTYRVWPVSTPPPAWDLEIGPSTNLPWTERARDQVAAALRRALQRLAHDAGVHLYAVVVVAMSPSTGNVHAHVLLSYDPFAIGRHGVLLAPLPPSVREGVAGQSGIRHARNLVDLWLERSARRRSWGKLESALVSLRAQEVEAMLGHVFRVVRDELRVDRCDPQHEVHVGLHQSSSELYTGLGSRPFDHGFELYLADHLDTALQPGPIFDAFAICPGRTAPHGQCRALKRPCLYNSPGRRFEKAPGGRRSS